MSRQLPASTDYWLDRPVLVTGCTGFLGSWLTIALVDAGAAVAGLIRDDTPFSQLRLSGYEDRIAVVRGDVTDYELVETPEKPMSDFVFPPDPRPVGVRLKDKFAKIPPFPYELHDGKGFLREDVVDLERVNTYYDGE